MTWNGLIAAGACLVVSQLAVLPAHADWKDEVARGLRKGFMYKGCITQVEESACKFVTKGPDRYATNVRSELSPLIAFGLSLVGVPNLKPIPTDKEVSILGVQPGLPSSNCGAGVDATWIYDWKPTGKKCPKK
jgi:hypothetical protein